MDARDTTEAAIVRMFGCEEDAEINKAVRREEQERNAYYDRLDGMNGSFGHDVRRLYDLAQKRAVAGAVCRQILLAVHEKRGSVDLFELRHLSLTNKLAALRLIELCATPSRLLDGGLTGILSRSEIEALYSGPS